MERWIEEDIDHLTNKFGIQSAFDLARDLGINVQFNNLGSNIYGYNNNSHRIPMIVINNTIDERTQDGVCYHEIFHIRHHKGFNTQFFAVNTTSFLSDDNETEANKFMLAMLKEEYGWSKQEDVLDFLDFFKLPHELVSLF
ncbi:ImmA/IrrE family metallo-endopeptidase [Lactiplantibacillus plantarum]|uniref:ImmA/IrrE family metallo-endopeptidase n=1 Tax=Lactiplantibacillus plantarum TaxID=1590 RepID=UPI0015A38D70|nr:ImmA/IrrE family metallo-endopeptidase [Lactiplantibacillus plantarum]MBX4152844.1 ImmA/IrrE family metallo-endopeptidase [Lactiplantibacillus plantarum]MED7642551.1 ImmA/IrrE family metallo-endopeptidase [Lactiplantibacillus plantarum]NVO63597.1 ImmA/IrrE family metallo-endopeptidase [Lactiplantibacillus plantarum]QOF01331.1 ImmA/IrrE family metallo-endopeptidase [Lactiplantibacillus plantarum]UVO56497.1 ImmA/IrrE family metallo-endopeptidase [Lactiplantibacillus plantarum]